MSVENVALKYAGSLTRIGKMALNIQYPKEFELYMCGLELVDQNFKTIQYFMFPVMPTTMDETQTFGTNVKKTLGGVTVLNTSTFIPRDVTLAGTFGRKFRVVLGDDYQDLISSFKTQEGAVTLGSVGKGLATIFDSRIKTGYGCIKILEEIVNSANKINNGKSPHLILHNPALGNSYLIKPMSLKLSTSQETNMIWSYSLLMKAIAPIEALYSDERLKEERFRLVTTGFIQQTADRAVNKLTELL